MLLQLDGQGPRYTQIRRAICELIQRGVLGPGTRVPPTRELARDLGCSRNLVLLAYEQLAIEGYLTARRGGGTFVASGLPAGSPDVSAALQRAIPIRLSRHGRRIVEVTGTAVGAVTRRPRSLAVDFVYGLCEPDERIVETIRTVVKRVLRERPFEYANVAGDEVLRRQLALRLRSARGIVRPAEHLLVTSGAQQAIDICVRLLVNPGDRIVVEDPTYRGVDSALVTAGADILRVPVDRHGLVVSDLPEGGPPVRFVYVTPSHQFPTGAVMPASRRYALLAWARRTGALILEDDYDSEFRHDGRPIEALAARSGRDLLRNVRQAAVPFAAPWLSLAPRRPRRRGGGLQMAQRSRFAGDPAAARRRTDGEGSLRPAHPPDAAAIPDAPRCAGQRAEETLRIRR